MNHTGIYSNIHPDIMKILNQENIMKLYPPQEEALSYSLTGKNIVGPPLRPLDAYTVEISGEDIVVTKT